MIVMAPVIYTAAVDFTLNMLVEGFGPETQAILLLPPKWLIVIFISTDILSGQCFISPSSALASLLACLLPCALAYLSI